MNVIEPTVITKKSSEAFAIDFEFKNVLPAGDSVQSEVVTADPGITLGNKARAGTIVQQHISAGTAGSRYRVACRATGTPSGWVRELVGYIQVQEG